MRRLMLSDVAAAVAGRLVGPDVAVSSAEVDSRRVRPEALFVAIRRDGGDGHSFVGDAFRGGAAAAMVNREWSDAETSTAEDVGPLLVVEDTGRALLAVAGHERAGLRARVVGITGSTGKTCTKDFLAAVLASRFETVASPASFNNEVGLPLTILAADEDTEALICEMGSRGIGHIARLCEVARPDVGIVTNVGLAHMGLFGTRQNVAIAKSELVRALPPEGVAILNGDDPVVADFAAVTSARVLTYGVTRSADVKAEDIELRDDGRPSFTLVSSGERERVDVTVAGEHMVWNALAASACGIALGVSAAECAAAIKGARVSAWRMETFETEAGIRVVNDAYNANPTSMAAALKALRSIAGARRSVAVLGQMAELGSIAREEHERVGDLVARLGIDLLVTVGPEAGAIAVAAKREGVEPEHVISAASPDEASRLLSRLARRGDVVLVKGSRAAGLEKVAASLGEVAR